MTVSDLCANCGHTLDDHPTDGQLGPCAPVDHSRCDDRCDQFVHDGEAPETVRQHFNGHCCAYDPECEHSFLDIDELLRHMDSPCQAQAVAS